YRLGATAPDYEEARPFHDALVAANPRNLVWGTDWPPPRPEGPVPDAARLRDIFRKWTTPANQQAILVDNPARLYDFLKADINAQPRSLAYRADWRRRGGACRRARRPSAGLPTRPAPLQPRGRACAIPSPLLPARGIPPPVRPGARCAARTRSGNARSARPVRRSPPADSFARARGAGRTAWSTGPAGRHRASPRRDRTPRRAARASATRSYAAACRA